MRRAQWAAVSTRRRREDLMNGESDNNHRTSGVVQHAASDGFGCGNERRRPFGVH